MHGFGGSNTEFYDYSHFDLIAEEYGVVVIYPQGYENSWNAGWCCGDAKDEGIEYGMYPNVSVHSGMLCSCAIMNLRPNIRIMLTVIPIHR